MSFLRSPLALMLLFAPPLASQVVALPADSVAIARRAARWAVNGHADSLLGVLASTDTAHHRSIERMVAGLHQNAEAEVSLIEERWVWRNRQRQYWRVIEVQGNAPEPVVVRLTILPSGAIGGLGVSLLSSVPAVDPGPPAQ